MKAFLLTSSALLAGLFADTVVGHPHPMKRAIVTEVTWTTVTVANVYVYLDENGVPYQTTTIDETSTVASATATAATSTLSSTGQGPAAPAQSSKAAEPTPIVSGAAVHQPNVVQTQPAKSSSVVSSAPASSKDPSSAQPPAPSSSTTSSAAPLPETPSAASSSYAPAPSSATSAAQESPMPTAKTSDDGTWPLGVTYDLYTANGCKSDSDVASEFDKMKQFGVVRIYGSSCNTVPLAVKNAKRLNQKILAGIWLTTRGGSDDIDSYVKTLSQAVKDNGGDWSIIAGVSVENERVNDRDETVSAVVDAINRARSALRGLGYNGPVAAVDTVPAILDNPAICQASDIVMANIHPFFDTHTNAEGAGQFVQDQIALLKNKCNNKRVVVTESGWPSAGDSHDNAVPSPANQQTALNSLKSKFSGDLFFHNAFDDDWKQDWDGSFNAEKHWGILK